jgi:xanthine dehydrogenase molybdenum-binding subunit
MAEYASVGQSVHKVDARAKVTGRAAYADDIRLPGTLYGKIVRCWRYAHARVKSLDLSEAARVPGVIKVLGPGDVTSRPYNTGVLDLMVPREMGRDVLGDIEDQHIFTEHVKHQGDAICGIVASSEEAAEKAAQKVRVEYEQLPVYHTADESKREDAVQFTPQKPGNLAFSLPEAMFPGGAYGWGDVDAAMQEADFTVEDTFYVPKVKQCQMEPHSYVALYDDEGRLNCWTSTQMPKCVHIKLAELFELPMSRVKINQTVVGGGFGARLGMIGEPEACALAMAVPGRPVKVTFLREEDWVASESRHPGKYWMRIGFKRDGTPVAVDAETEYWGGGYYTHASGVTFTTGSWLAGMYKWGACRYRSSRYYTNQAPCGAFRGYGNPQTNWVMEQLVDRACAELDMDPVEWRLKWHKDVGDDGWCLGVTYPSCALSECLAQGAERFGWKEKRQRYAQQTGRKRRGVGVGVMNHTSGAMPMLLEHTACTVKLNEDATAEVIMSCSDLGTGAHTSLRQIAAQSLGLALDEVHMKVGDSDAAGFDIGAHASRTLYVGGNAVIEACADVRRQILASAASMLGEDPQNLELDGKTVRSRQDRGKSVPVREVAFNGVYNFPDPETGRRPGVPGQIQGYSSHYPASNSPPFAAVFVEVEVDVETGEIWVIDVVNAHDIGRAIHPPSVQGQLEGGTHQALGMALTEETYYDENGLCLNGSFTDYKMLGPSDMPNIQCLLVEQPDPHGPYGAKSVGESGTVAPTGATANAVYNAIGIQFTEGPILPEKVLRAIREKGID